MEFDDFDIKPALLGSIINAEDFYRHYDPHQHVPVDRELLSQIILSDFNRIMEEVRVSLSKNRDWAYTFDYLIKEMQKDIPERLRLRHIAIFRWMVSERVINGNYIQGKYYHCFRRSKV